MIPAKEFESELWIKASDHHKEVKRAIDAEREACAKVCDEHWRFNGSASECADAIRARGNT